MKELKIKTEYITVQQFLKIENFISSGGEAKYYLLDNEVYVNSELENRRGRKLYPGYVIKVENTEYKIVISEAASSVEKNAAKELQDFFEEASLAHFFFL